jgi:DNA-binding SARP family transcriptional activator/tetratricopeptide (TPR) repeat protein
MEVLLLGLFELRDSRGVVALRRQKHRALVAFLALRPREVVSSDTLVEELWGGDPPKTARQALQNYVSLLRKQLGADTIETHASGYALNVESEQVDALRFEQLVHEARGAEGAEERGRLLRAALGLWRAPAFADLLYEPFAATASRRLEDLRLVAGEELVDAELELGRHTVLISELEVLIRENPFRERLRGQLMLALYRAGRQADALRAYRDARDALAELGLDAGVQLRSLEQAILNQDPTLDLETNLPDVEERRKTVTVLLCDLAVDAMGLDPEQVRRKAVPTLAGARAAIELHGGVVETRAGDELLGIFGLPATHEDDALRAARTAVQIRSLAPRLRAGIDTGEVLTGHGFVSGDVVARAKRFEREADPGEVLIGGATVALCGDAVTAEPTEDAFRLLAAPEQAQAISRALDTPLVGRDRELGLLRDAFEQTCGAKRAQLLAVIGEPGIGKTRLARELALGVEEETTVLVGRCVSYGLGATWLPLGEMLQQAGERLDGILERATSPGEVFLETRQILERLARVRPMVLVFDDVHWAEPTLLDFVDYLGKQAAGPILCLCLSRPELVETRPYLAANAIRLGPLSEEEAEALSASVDSTLRPRLLSAAGGNPLFLEQLMAFAQEGGTVDAVPPSLEALIAARLDLLHPEEQALLHRAAVIGRSFERALLPELGGVVERLAGLEEKGLVRRLARGGYRFHHVLVREVAYASLPKAERAELHERLADLLADRGDADELVGYHLEQAHRLGCDLRPLDRQLRRLGADAGERLGAAGVEAWRRGDSPAAINLLTRACELLPKRNPFRPELLCYLGPALYAGGALSDAEAVLEGAVDATAAAGNRPLEWRARLELASLRLASDPEGRVAELLELAEKAIPLFEALGDEQALGRTWRFLADVHGAMKCHYKAAVDASERALACYERCGWPTSTSVGDLAAFLYYGPAPVPEAIDRCRRLLASTSRGGEAATFTFLGGLEAMGGQFEAARQLVAKARRLYEALGQTSAAEANCGTVAARIEVLDGEHVAAEDILRKSCAALEHMGNRAYLATRAAELADVLYARGRDDEAEEWVSRAIELAASDDITTQLFWRCVRGKLLARRGMDGEGESLVREAIHLADATDALNYQARAHLDLAQVLGIAGRVVEASAAAEASIELFDRKGNAAASQLARTVLEEHAPLVSSRGATTRRRAP